MLTYPHTSKIMALLAVVAFYSTSAHATDYNLNCRLGGDMGHTYNARSQRVTVTFSHANQGTRQQPLRNGQCSWVDRPFRSGEPHKFCQSRVNDLVLKLNARSYSVSSRKAPYLARIKNSNQDGGYFSLKVHNNGQGCMEVTRVNSFRKASTITGR